MLRAKTLVVAIALVAIAAPSRADDFPTALRQLQALASVASAGVTIDEYQRRVLDAKILVDRYLAKPDGDAKRRHAVASAIGLYVLASSSWRYAITGNNSPLLSDDCPPGRDFLVYVTKEATEHVRELGAGKTLELIQSQYKAVVPIYWACASDWTRTATGSPEPRYPPFVPPPKSAREPASAPAPGFRPRTQSADPFTPEQREKINEINRTRPYCKWVWNGEKWVSECVEAPIR
jgi:hypothetical protein